MAASSSSSSSCRRNRKHLALSSSFTVTITIIAAFFIKLTDQLRFEAIQIPSLVQRGTNFWLSCQFRLDQDQQLYSVKWYKNNEEFYRLLLSSSSSSSLATQLIGNEISTSNELSNQFQSLPSNQHQQYFSQSGVNVLMSSSNATHVRLLNASLDSEGFYACEISTQNLSSIRYEREIRVYVLPTSRLSVIGFKSRYSLGDRLDLACTSDYSRPRPALAWYINNQLIEHKQQQPELGWFTLESQNRSKLNEPTLFKQTLSLKFKLTPELMQWILLKSGTGAADYRRRADNNQGNQSLVGGGGGLGNGESFSSSSSSSSYQQLQLTMRLHCKYKLTEVSDLTFNELLVAQKSSRAAAAAAATASTSSSLTRKQLRLASGSRRPTTSDAVMSTVLVSKLPDNNRVSQSKCPASRIELQAALLGYRRYGYTTTTTTTTGDGECRLGQLALQPDDPLIVANPHPAAPGSVEDSSSPPSSLTEISEQDDNLGDGDGDGNGDSDSDAEDRKRGRRQVIGGGLELSIGELISVNCSTISNLIDPAATSDTRHSDDTRQSICYDLEARRRSLISGKYQQTESAPPIEQDAANQRVGVGWHKTRQPNGATGRRADSSARGQQQHQWSGGKFVSQLMLTRRQLESLASSKQQQHEMKNSTSSFSGAAESTLSTASTTTAIATTETNGGASGNQLEAPPLLEWFINNQEVLGLGTQPPGGDTGDAEPPIDYASYFANFDSKSIQQHLPLRLNLTKEHFSTPDSNLRLRCSSTQAQVLLAETVTLTLIGQLDDFLHGPQGWQQKSSSGSSKQSRIHNKHPLNYLDRSKLVSADNGCTSSQYHSVIVWLSFLVSIVILKKSIVILLIHN